MFCLRGGKKCENRVTVRMSRGTMDDLQSGRHGALGKRAEINAKFVTSGSGGSSAAMLVAPVTALCFSDNGFLLAGLGRCLEVWLISENKCVLRDEHALSTESSIYGIQKLHGDLLLVFGGRELCIATIDYAALSFCKRQPLVLSDRILAATLYRDQIVLVLAHGQIVVVNDNLQILSKCYLDNEDHLLYSARVFTDSHQRLCVAMGTVFQGIEVFEIRQQRLLHRFRLAGDGGHKGSIFDLDHCCGMLATVSDDRTVRVWDISQALDTCQIIDTPVAYADQHSSANKATITIMSVV